MTQSNRARVQELEALIRRHQDLYYNGQPELSDAEFDELWDELRSLDPGNAALASVGSDSADGWPKTQHLMPMGSQEKASNPEDFLLWAAKTAHPEYLVQYKLDGASLELQYEKGQLLRAVTRGDGDVGDDISPNARHMQGVVVRLAVKFSGGIRGEVIMTHEIHDGKYADKANCRNAANGLMKRKDGQGSEDLHVICYDADGGVETADGGMTPPWSDELGKLEWLDAMGFTTVPMRVCRTAQDVVDYRAQIMDIRPSLPYDIDGLVVKGREIDRIDAARARPEKQIAFKFSLEEAISTLRAVEWSESGANYTPIGIMDPVRLAGTTVQRANLVNTNAISKMGLKIGSRIVITKRGEIIPKIEGCVETPGDALPIEIPSVCSCGTVLVDEGTRLYCPNLLCPKRSLHRLEKWLSVLDIRDFGSAILGQLFASGRVKEIADLYTLTVKELAAYDRMGELLATKILRNLKAKNSVSLASFVAGFDIEGIGTLIAEKAVAAGYDSLEKLRAVSVEELDAVDGFAEITARALIDGLRLAAPEMDRLLQTGALSIVGPQPGAALAGRSFCFTGELSMKRSEAESRVRELGGSVKSSVTKGLSYLVTNDPGSGSEKNKKARALGVSVIDEAAFLALLEASR
ncbi:MAG TPA: NAD-dependent DNA ligase LigA [Rectinemataceae bacterium]|nr:NAD-dependent DNA ligase LigA [Rectinemataceae bacterium]